MNRFFFKCTNASTEVNSGQPVHIEGILCSCQYKLQYFHSKWSLIKRDRERKKLNTPEKDQWN